MGGKGSGRKPKKNPELAKDRPAYDRQEFESDFSWRAFTIYRDMGAERTVAGAVKALGKRTSYRTTMEGWSMKHGWVKRCAAWDRFLDEKARAVQVKAAEEKAALQAQVADGLWTLAGKDLEHWHAKMKMANAVAKKAGRSAKPLLSTKEIESLAKTGIQLSRLLADQPGEITEHQVSDLAALARRAVKKKEEDADE